MKLLSKCAILMVLLTSPVAVKARKDDVEKRKMIEKVFEVSGNTGLEIKNTFGKVHINTWVKDQIAVRVEVISRRNNSERAQEMLDQIDIQISEGSNISFKTQIKGGMKNVNSDRFEINYEVSMPPSNKLALENSFGDVYVSSRTGQNEIELSYGDFKLGQLEGDTRLKVSFSDGEADLISRGDLTVKYSNVELEKVGVVKLETSFSDVEVVEAQTLDLISKYGELEIGQVKGVKGSASFCGFSIGLLEQELDLQTQYANGFEIERVSRSFDFIKLSGKFDGYKLQFEEGTNASFEITTKFCDFSYETDNLEMNYRVKDDFQSQYRGTIGNGKGGVIYIVSSYGDVKFK